MIAAGLVVRDLVVRFGGHTAVDQLSFDAPLGQLTGLIGPNGAGKTTTFNACSGLSARAEGSVMLFGQDVSSAGPSARAQLGLGRTFQRMQLFDSLSVADNVRLGRIAHLAGSSPLRQVLARRSDHELVETATESALGRCGIHDLRDRQVRDLSTGQRRLVELARVIAGPFRLLLLDEPSSGLDDRESQRFGAILMRLVEEDDRGILLVEHDMALVMETCDHLYVLDGGRLIFDGTPTEVQTSELVQHAYLGTGRSDAAR
ncbi:MAG TPA: ABC transporter ATP-binding protein [Acidimicrobiales bacterium]